MTNSNDFVIIASFTSRSELKFVLFTSLLESECIEYNVFSRNNIATVGGWSAEALEIFVRQKDAENARNLHIHIDKANDSD